MINMNFCWCIIIALIIVLFTDNILNTFPILKVLFTDSINYILIMLLVIFIMLIDLHCGIILGLVILYISMYVNSGNSNKNVITISSTNPEHTSINDVIFKNVVNSNLVNNTMSEHKVKFAKETTIINPTLNHSNEPNDNTILSESEFIYNNTKPFPNNNLKPFQPPVDNSSNTTQTTNTVNLVQQKINTEAQNDFITQVGEPDRSGFDITGCRYDMKNSPQNLTKYGPPLAQCSAYDVNKIKTCGTAFYPLNA